MKNITLTLITLFISTYLLAQEYDINSYKFRYQKFKGLILDPSFNSDGNHSFQNTNDKNLTEPRFDNSNSWLGSISLNGRYFKNINLESLQQNMSISGDNLTDWRIAKDLESQNGPNNFQIGNRLSNSSTINYSNIERRYGINESFKYRGNSAYINFRLATLNGESENSWVQRENRQNSQYLRTRLSASFGKGKGRIDNVGDVIEAHFILEDLKTKKGIEYSNAQLEQLAQSITFIKNQRYLDFRFALIDQLELLDSSLFATKIDVIRDMTYFTILSDNWLYARDIGRSSGKRWTYYYTQELNLEGQRNQEVALFDYSDTLREDINFYSLNFNNNQGLNSSYTVQYIQRKQLSWRVQQSFAASLIVGVNLNTAYFRGNENDSMIIRPERNGFNPSATITPQANLSATWEHRYQPDSRTFYIARISPSIIMNDVRQNDSTTSVWSYTNNSFNPRLNLFFDYYKWFNPHFAFTVRTSINVNHTRDNTGPVGQLREITINEFRINHDARIGFTYQLF